MLPQITRYRPGFVYLRHVPAGEYLVKWWCWTASVGEGVASHAGIPRHVSDGQVLGVVQGAGSGIPAVDRRLR